MPSHMNNGTEYHSLPRFTTNFDGTTQTDILFSGFKSVAASAVVKGDRDVPHPWFFTVHTYRVPQGSKTYLNTYPNVSWKREEGNISLPEQGYTLDFQDTGIARVKCLAKVISTLKNTELNLATTLGEGRETYNMLADIVRGVRRVKKKLKSARLRGIVKEIRRKRKLPQNAPLDWREPIQKLGGAELYYALGVKPLIADVEAFVEHASKGLTDKLVIPFRGRASHVQNFSTSYDQSIEGLTVRTDETLSVSERTMMAGFFQIGDLHSFENWRAGLVIRPSLLWELLTLSFLIDYFLKVGQFLELWEATALSNGYTVKEAYQTDSSFVSRTLTLDGITQPSGSGIFLTQLAAVGGQEIRSSNRTVLGGNLPLPDLPRLKLPKAASQLLNVASLLSQLLKH